MTFSEGLLATLVKVFSAEEVCSAELKGLIPSEQLLLIVVLKMRGLISDDCFNRVSSFIGSERHLAEVVARSARCSDFGAPGLTRSVWNRVLRRCFVDWLADQRFEIANGKVSRLGARVSNCEINRLFWGNALFCRAKGPAPGESSVAALLPRTKNKTHTDQKVKTKRICKPRTRLSASQAKRLGIFFKKPLCQGMLSAAARKQAFVQHFRALRREVLGQYSSKATCRQPAHCRKDPNVLCFRDSLKKTLEKVLEWFRRNGAAHASIDAKALKVLLRQVPCPATRGDYLRAFESIERKIGTPPQPSPRNLGSFFKKLR